MDAKVNYHDFYEFNEGKEWECDFYKMIWDTDLKDNLYAVIQYIEVKEGVKPTVNTVISRKLIEAEYNLIGYSVIQLNNPDGTIRWGTYTVDIYKEPILVEELNEEFITGYKIKVTIGRPGTNIKPQPIRRPDRPAIK